jgi:hypothetical protein
MWHALCVVEIKKMKLTKSSSICLCVCVCVYVLKKISLFKVKCLCLKDKRKNFYLNLFSNPRLFIHTRNDNGQSHNNKKSKFPRCVLSTFYDYCLEGFFFLFFHCLLFFKIIFCLPTAYSKQQEPVTIVLIGTQHIKACIAINFRSPDQSHVKKYLFRRWLGNNHLPPTKNSSLLLSTIQINIHIFFYSSFWL